MGLVENADGSVDLYFSPKATRGFEKHWVPTVPGKAWFAHQRLYAPTEPCLEKGWPMPDIERVK